MPNDNSKWIVLARVIGQMIFVYGLLGWIYGVALQFWHSESLTYPLSHLTPWIRVDTFTIISFLLSALGFLVWKFIAEVTDSSQEQA